MKTLLVRLALVAATLLVPTSAYADVPDLSVLNQYAKADGTLDLQRLQADYVAQRAQLVNHAPARSSPSPVPVDPPAPVAATPQPASTPAPSLPPPTFAFAVRQNFNDVGLFGAAKLKDSVFDSHGASVSWTRDAISHNTLWAVEGVATAVWAMYEDYSDTDAPKLLGFYASPYVQVDRNLNSNPKLSKKNVDTDGFGGAAEMGFDNLLGGQHYFHDRLGIVDDNIKGSRSISNVFEWIPVYSHLHIHFPDTIPGTPIRFRVDPELKVQYDSSTKGNVLDFATQQDALRIGPQVSLIVRPYGIENSIVSSMHFNTTLHWAEEVYSHRPYWWFAPSLGLNLDKAGNFGLSLDYKKGHDEISGQKMDMVKPAFPG